MFFPRFVSRQFKNGMKYIFVVEEKFYLRQWVIRAGALGRMWLAEWPTDLCRHEKTKNKLEVEINSYSNIDIELMVPLGLPF